MFNPLGILFLFPDLMERTIDQHKRWLGWGLMAAGLFGLWGCEGETTVEKATEDGIFLLGNSAEPKGLDPHIVSGVLENNIISALSRMRAAWPLFVSSIYILEF